MLKRLFSSTKRPYIPGINSPENITVDLSGSTLSFKLLPNQDFEGFGERVAPVSTLNAYNTQAFEHDLYGLFSNQSMYSRRWELYGVLWDPQPIGSIRANAHLMRADTLPDGMSCLNPSQFEQVINRYLFNHGPEQPEYGVRVAPVNWQVYKTHDTPWVYCEERDKNQVDEVAWHAFAFAPLDDELFVLATFYCINSDQKDVINEHFRSIIRRVISTFDLKYRPEVQAKILRLQSKTKRWAYTEQRDPEDWVYPWAWHRGSREHGQPPIIVTEPGTPAPTYTK